MTPTDIIRQALNTLPDNSPPDVGAPFILLDGRDSRLICPRVLRGWIRHLLAELDKHGRRDEPSRPKDISAILSSLLVKHGVIQPAAVEDPEGYDNYATLNALLHVAQDIAEMDGRDAEIRKLRAVISQTLAENAHLADGDNCTLMELKQAVTPEAQAEFSLTGGE